jgi:hypothetical protein
MIANTIHGIIDVLSCEVGGNVPQIINDVVGG